MKQTRANAVGIVFAGIFFIFVIIGIVVTFIIVNKDSDFFNKPTEKNAKIKLYLKTTDSQTKEDLDASYILKSDEIKQGDLIKGFNEINLINDFKGFEIYCKADNYYSRLYSKNFTTQESQNNISQFDCELNRIGNINIIHKGNLNNELNKIRLNLSTNNHISRLGVCFSWTSAIINVHLKEIGITCPSGLWTNISKYEGEKPIHYENNKFKCGLDYFETCEKIKGNICTPMEIDMPYRFVGQYDSCYYLGKSLIPGEIYELPLEVQTLEYKNNLDYLKITFFDNDLVHEGDFIYKDNLNGEDIGAEDTTYVIEYG
jgi:hypothetical protein